MSNNALYFNPRSFPIDALPPLLRDAVYEVDGNIQAPIPLIAASALGALSMATQNTADVMRPNGLVSPVSLFVLTVAESGERKSTVDALFTQYVRDIERESAAQYELELKKHEAEMLVLKFEEKRLLKVLTSTKESSNGRSLLEAHLGKKPIKPKKIRLIYNDATSAAIKFGLSENWKSIGIISAEGGVVFNGPAMRDLAFINEAWGGATIHVERRSSQSFTVDDPRVTFSGMIQPQIFQKFMSQKGGEFRGIGALARMLVSYPFSTQGSRPIYRLTPSWQHLPTFQTRLKSILQQNIDEIEAGTFTRQVLEFSPEAAADWIKFYNVVESDIKFGGYLFDVRDYASKSAENVARIAALFHLLEGEPGKISIDTLRNATKVSHWFIGEFKRLFSIPPQIPLEIADANELETWLRAYCYRCNGNQFLNKNVVAQLGPNQLRKSKIRREAALYVLMTSNKIAIFNDQKSKTVIIQLQIHCFPVILPPPPFAQQYQRIPTLHNG